ncbi:hypothetical protein HK414_15550 [Ramlibacter terrae]|uniref:Glycosyltransferase family 9 protein n=1 Tax=Ramlibacter terrae TaxID=2732511 RepID=A0ABX6P5C8_9BURK|nr:hypothetical protein HK414_15550 [Ramlibacter terrae]
MPRPNEPVVYASPPLPRWNGEPLEGKAFALWFEQGMGDALQMLRYVPLLRQRGLRKLTVVGPPALRSLLAGVPGVDAVVVPGEQIGWHDHWCLMMSLPLHFGTTLETIPAALPYLRPDAERVARWAPKLPGACAWAWCGKARICMPTTATARCPGWRRCGRSGMCQASRGSACRRARPKTRRPRRRRTSPLVPPGSEVEDFADLAAVVAQLDLVVCVDTAVAHLAGALGKPAWVLLPQFASDWRWLHQRTDSPRYPGVLRLFRQQVAGDWSPVVRDVQQALVRRVLASQPRNAQARMLLASLSPPVSRAAMRRAVRPAGP